MTDLGAHVYVSGGMRYLRTCSEGSKSTCFGHFLLNHLQTRRKPTGHWWVECGKEVVGKTVNSERAHTDPLRTYVPGNGRQAPAKRAQTARVAPALHLLRLNLSPHYLADQCFYFERSRGPGSRRGFAQGQSYSPTAKLKIQPFSKGCRESGTNLIFLHR